MPQSPPLPPGVILPLHAVRAQCLMAASGGAGFSELEPSTCCADRADNIKGGGRGVVESAYARRCRISANHCTPRRVLRVRCHVLLGTLRDRMSPCVCALGERGFLCLLYMHSPLTVNSQSTHSQLTVNSQSTHSQHTVNSGKTSGERAEA